MKFSEVMEEVEGKNPAILLGSGFCQGYDSDYCYPDLSNEVIAEFKKYLEKNNRGYKLNNSEVKVSEKIIELVENDNRLIEDIILLLDSGDKSFDQIHEAIGCEKSKMKINFSKIKLILMNMFVEALIKKHPFRDENKIKRAVVHLSKFYRIFTLNYDLILYWTFLYANEENKSNFKDGFSRKGSDDDIGKVNFFTLYNNIYTVHYLHGALFIFQKDEEILKISVKNDFNFYFNTKDQQKNLIDKIREVFESLIVNVDKEKVENDQGVVRKNDITSTVVVEGSTVNKESLIYRSPYLLKMYNRLDELKGPLVIYGCSIINQDGKINNDHHIWRRVFKDYSDTNRKIYIGIKVENNDTDDYFNDQQGKRQNVIENFFEEGRNPPNVNYFKITDDDNIWA